MEKLISLQIDGTELELIEGVHVPSSGGVGYVGAGKPVTDVDAKWDGWVDAVIDLKYEEQIYGWMLKEQVHLVFKTDAGEFDFPSAILLAKEEADDGVRILGQVSHAFHRGNTMTGGQRRA